MLFSMVSISNYDFNYDIITHISAPIHANTHTPHSSTPVCHKDRDYRYDIDTYINERKK